jgi:hypothetical protein
MATQVPATAATATTISRLRARRRVSNGARLDSELEL